MLRQLQRTLIGVAGFEFVTETAQQVGAGGVGESVGRERAGGERIDEGKAGSGTVAHGDSDGAIELSDGTRLGSNEQIIERRDAHPRYRNPFRRRHEMRDYVAMVIDDALALPTRR